MNTDPHLNFIRDTLQEQKTGYCDEFQELTSVGQALKRTLGCSHDTSRVAEILSP